MNFDPAAADKNVFTISVILSLSHTRTCNIIRHNNTKTWLDWHAPQQPGTNTNYHIENMDQIRPFFVLFRPLLNTITIMVQNLSKQKRVKWSA